MPSFGTQLFLFLLLVLLLSPHIEAREGRFFSFFSHFRSYDVKNPQGEAPSPAPTPTPAAPAPESILVSSPAPEPVFVDRGDGYGLYGSDTTQFSPTTTSFENELLNEELIGESYKTGYSNSNLYSGNPVNYDKQLYRNNFNNQEYPKNYVDSYSNNYYNGNGYNEKYYYDGRNANENYNLHEFESGRGSTVNEGYYEKNKYPNEFNTVEEYEEKQQQESQGYMP